jgi:hypothetical protein
VPGRAKRESNIKRLASLAVMTKFAEYRWHGSFGTSNSNWIQLAEREYTWILPVLTALRLL